MAFSNTRPDALALVMLAAVAAPAFPSLGRSALEAQELPDSALARHVAVLESQGADPLDFVLDKLREYDLLVFDDALHTAVEPFQFYGRLVRSLEFRTGGRLVFLEAISLNQQPHIEAYLEAPDDDPTLLYPAFQNGVGGEGFPYVTYFDFLASVRAANESLPAEDRIRVIAVGSPSWWPEIRTARDLEIFRASLDSYDHTMYRMIVRGMEGFAGSRKGIVLTNTRHAYKGIRNGNGELYWNAGTFLHEWHPGRTYHVRFNSANLIISAARDASPGERTTQGLERMEFEWGRVAHGLWDSAVHAHGRWPIAVPIVGNVFGGAPYVGNHMLNAAPGQTMADAYDAVIFLAPLEEQRQTATTDDIYTPGFMVELERRHRLLHMPEQIAERMEEAGVASLAELLVREHMARPEGPLTPARAVGPMDAWQTTPLP